MTTEVAPAASGRLSVANPLSGSVPCLIHHLSAVDVHTCDVDAELERTAAGFLDVFEVAADTAVLVLARGERERLADDFDAERVRQRDRPVDAATRGLDDGAVGLRRSGDRDRE